MSDENPHLQSLDQILETGVWDNIQAIPVVNLDSRPERMERLLESAEGVLPTGLIQRMPAVLGKELHGFGSSPWFRRRTSDARWAARAGCILSHGKIIKLAAAKCWDHTLILEDDATFDQTSASDLAGILEFLFSHPLDWDVCYLGYSKATGPARHIATRNNHRICEVSGCATTHAYLVNAKARDWILQNLPSEFNIWPWVAQHRAIDRWYARTLSKHLKILAVTPSLVPQADGFSDIIQDHVNYATDFPCAVTNLCHSKISYSLSRFAWWTRTEFDNITDSMRAHHKRSNGF